MYKFIVNDADNLQKGHLPEQGGLWILFSETPFLFFAPRA
jgi:hypothetical protein